MAILKQNSTSDTLYIGWYGLSQNECNPFPLTEQVQGFMPPPAAYRHKHFQIDAGPVVGPSFTIGESSFFRSVKEVNAAQGGTTAYDGTITIPFALAGLQLNELQCGHSYFITLKPGNDELEIPEFTFANYASSYEYRIAEDCAPVTALEKLWISFTGNDHYSDWYELETDEQEEFTKFKIVTPNYGSDLYTWASGKATNLQGILMTASENKPSATSLTDDQKAKTFASDLLNLKCNDVFNNGHELADNQVNLRVQAYNNQDVPALKKYGSHNNTHNYLGTGKPWEGANMVYRTTTFNSIVTDDSGKNSIDIDYLYFIKNTNEDDKIKFSTTSPANSTCDGVF